MWRIVDEHLRQAQAVVGAGPIEITPTHADADTSSNQPDTWGGGAADNAAAVSAHLLHTRTEIREIQAHVAGVVCDADDTARQAHTTISAIAAAWQRDKAALYPFADTAEGQVGMLGAAQRYIGEATDAVESVGRQYHRNAEQIRAATRALPNVELPEAAVPYEPPPPVDQATAPCWIGTADGDIATLCPANTDTVTYVDDAGNYVSKDLKTGQITIMFEPGPQPDYPQTCWLPSAQADRSICGPGTTTWQYPHEDHLITEELQPDGQTKITFQTPLGPLIP